MPAPPLGFAALLGCLWVGLAPALPRAGLAMALAIAGAAALLYASCERSRDPAATGSGWLAWVSVLLLWAGVAALHGHRALTARLSPDAEGRDWQVVLRIDALPARTDHGWRMQALLQACEPPQAGCRVGLRMRLTWSDPDRVLSPGQRWRAIVRCRRPHGLLNPGGFDAERKALEDGVDALCTVRGGRAARSMIERLADSRATPSLRVESMRARLRLSMQSALEAADPQTRGVLLALAIGDQAAMPSDLWDRLMRTGTAHLFSISGTHVTMLAALAAWLVACAWRSRLIDRWLPQPLVHAVPTPWVAAAAAVSAACAYSALAGWGVPAARTCLMLAVAALAGVAGRTRSMPAVMSLAAAWVLAVDPLAALSTGFWLSFSAVATIVWAGSGHRRPAEFTDRPRVQRVRQRLNDAMRAQWAVTLGLLPLGALLFSSFSLIGPLANALAIPVITALVTPLALVGGALSLLWIDAGRLLLLADVWIVERLLDFLAGIDAPRGALAIIARPDAWALALGCLACAWTLSPVRIPGRRVAILGLLPVLIPAPTGPRDDALWVTAIDIGQGMAVMVETRDQRLLYDTGPSGGQGNDAGARVILPWLRQRGITHLDRVVVSHADADHAGGALSLSKALAVDLWLTSLPQDAPLVRAASRHQPCVRGQGWQWGDWSFEWLHPEADGLPTPGRTAPRDRSPTNARSCVLRIRSLRDDTRVLLSGDIEAAQERQLLSALGPDALRADILFAPHHGSATSSTPAFVDAVRPSAVVFQVGYLNRFGHPESGVLERWRRQGAALLRTDRDGAIRIVLRPGQPPVIERARALDQRWWRIRVDD